MNSNEKNKKKKNEIEELPYSYPTSVASTTECTGMIPFTSNQEDDLDPKSYTDIYDIPISPINAEDKI